MTQQYRCVGGSQVEVSNAPQNLFDWHLTTAQSSVT